MPSAPVTEIVMRALPRILSAGTHNLIALALVGSGARGEETWRDGELVSDLDIVAVMKTADPRAQRRFDAAARQLENDIAIGCSPLYSLSRYRTLEFYGAKHDGWVFWGAPNVFDRVRADGPVDIPRWEAPRLVLNRAMDFLRADAGLIPPWYAAMKAYIALGEAELILDRSYDPSYRNQQAQLASRVAVLGDQGLRDLIVHATAIKLDDADPRAFRADGEVHRLMLLSGLTTVFSRYFEREVELFEGLRTATADYHSLAHRLHYVARQARAPRRWSRVVAAEPIFWFWRVALEVLTRRKNLAGSNLSAFLADFAAVHQPLPR